MQRPFLTSAFRVLSSAPRFLAIVALGAFAVGCGDDEGTSPVPVATMSIYTVPDSLDALSGRTFLDHPWPSDLRLESGAPRFDGYYNPRQIPILDVYVEALGGLLDGFSPAAAGYVRFTGPVDAGSLPKDPGAATASTASVQLVDIDPASPEHGKRRPITLEWHGTEGVYWLPDTLAFMPTVGFPLRPHTRYAFVVTDALRSPGGVAVQRSATLSAVLGLGDAKTSAVQAAKAALAPAITELEAAGVARQHVIHLAVFTTARPTDELFLVRDAVAKDVPAPAMHAGAWKVQASTPSYDEYVGVYGPSPNYQAGALPFVKYGDGGQFQIENGKPKVVDLFDLRFSLMVPNAQACPMPAAGYPIVLYAHGTGGDYRSYVSDGSGKESAQRCVAMMGIDQIFHGTRPGAPPDGSESKEELLFYNFENPVAARTNGRQAAIDEVQRARLFTETHAVVPAAVSKMGKDILFDGSKLMFFGHSQGGLNAPLFLAADDAARGGVLSGSGALISIALLEKTLPVPSVKALVETVFLGLKADEVSELGELHPAISMAQSLVDVLDPIHYGRLIAAEPRPGFAPKSVYMTEGINADGTGDNYAPPHGIEAHALAVGLPLQEPFQRAIAESQWGGPQPIAIPPGGLSGDLGGGAASGVLAQWAVPVGSDGHYVVFDVPQASAQASKFLADLAADPKGLVPPP